jgi:hypothetical protein
MTVVMSGAPSRCPDVEIAALKARTDDCGVIRLPPPPTPSKRAFKKSEAIRIVSGPLAGSAPSKAA